MDIRPAPLHRVQRETDPGARLAVLGPIAALLLVVTAAWAGTGYRPDPIEAEPALPDTIPRAEPLGAARGLKAAGFGFPGLALGLPVRTGAELETGRADGSIGRELVVVAGVLRSEPLPLSCPAVQLTLSRAFCHRLAALFPVGDPDMEARSTTPAPGPTIAGHLLPGTEIPGFLGGQAAEVGPLLKPSIPVVLAGHFEDPRAPACGAGHEWCRSDFVVEHAVWADGLWLGTPIVRDPALPEPEQSAAIRASAFAVPGPGRSRIILGLALLRPELLVAVDPIAAHAAANTHGPVWYVRSIASVQAGEKPQVGWLVMEAATGVLLGYSWALL